jgi:riboflavin transporter FmnP
VDKSLGPNIRNSSREITSIAVFTALAIVLSKASIPAPFAGFLFYDVWEIPILIALLMFGLRAAGLVALFNFLILLLVNQGVIIAGPLYNLAAVLATFLGVIVGHRLAVRSGWGFFGTAALSTVMGIAARTGIMVVFNSIFLPLAYPLGFGVPAAPFLGAIAFFNATIALYLIPISYVVVRAITPRLRYRIAYPLIQFGSSPLHETSDGGRATS